MIKPKFLYNPVTIAECGGPCEQGPEYCDCGELRIDPPTPTELSPAAKAVLDAANGCSCYGPDDCLNESRWIAAAALREAADQLCLRWSELSHPAMVPPADVVLYSIADELEKTMCPQQQEDNHAS